MKALHVTKTIVLGVACLAALSAAFLPYWFTLTVQISYNGGRTMVSEDLNLGIFYMDRGSLNMISLLWVERNSNDMTLPALFKVAQIFYLLGVFGSFVCLSASAIYMCRKYKTATGEMCLAGGLFPSAMFLLLGVVFAVLQVVVGQNDVWESLPVPGHYMLLEATPEIKMNFGLYIGAGAALIAIISFVIAWIHAVMLCKHVEHFREQVLYAPLVDDELDPDGFDKMIMAKRASRYYIF